MFHSIRSSSCGRVLFSIPRYRGHDVGAALLLCPTRWCCFAGVHRFLGYKRCGRVEGAPGCSEDTTDPGVYGGRYLRLQHFSMGVSRPRAAASYPNGASSSEYCPFGTRTILTRDILITSITLLFLFFFMIIVYFCVSILVNWLNFRYHPSFSR